MNSRLMQEHPRFRIERRLGGGGSGTVYAAFDKERDAVVALKALQAPDGDDWVRFKQEFRVLANVAHPNLVTLYEMVASEDELFFTMELVEGSDFLGWVRPDGKVNEERLRDALRQMASGLAALHEAGKVHCDLKPNNVLVNADGRLVILDFGISYDLRPDLIPEKEPRGMAGTLLYTAPEQLEGVVSPASDWYAFGVMLFEALTGTFPFKGSFSALMLSKSKSSAPSPTQFAEDLPEDLVALCEDLLKTDPKRRPSGAEILRRLGQADVTEVSGVFEPMEMHAAFIGRKRPLAELRAAFAASRRRGIAVYVHGSSGMGKTALIEAFLTEVVDDGNAVVLSGRCYEQELVPYKALDGVVDSLSRYLSTLPIQELRADLPRHIGLLARLFPVLLQAPAIREETQQSKARRIAELKPDIAPDPLILRRRGFGALRELLSKLAERRPLVLFIDDLHWADADSTALLNEILRPPDPPKVMLLCSFRTEEIQAKPFLADLLADSGSGSAPSREVKLEPLAQGDVVDLAETLLGSRSRELLTRTIVQEAAGSPFLVEQLVRYSRTTSNQVGRGIGLSEMIDARIAHLPSGADDLLRILTVAGRPLDAVIAARVAGLDGDERPLVGALKAAQLLRGSVDAQQIELYHTRLREILLARIDADKQRAIHAQLAAALIEAGREDPEALYDHFASAGDEPAAAEQAMRAANKADEVFAFDRAALFLQRVLDLGEFIPERRLQLRRRLADTLADAGRPGRAAEKYLELANDLEDPEKRQACRVRAAEEYLLGGYFDEGWNTYRKIGEGLGLGLGEGKFKTWMRILWVRLRLKLRGLRYELSEEISPEDERRLDLYWTLASALTTIHPLKSFEFTTRQLLVALRVGEPLRLARALASNAPALVAGGGKQNILAAEKCLFTAREIGRTVKDPKIEATIYFYSGFAGYLQGRWRKGADLAREAERIFSEECRGVLWEQTISRCLDLSCRFYLGEIREVSNSAQAFLAASKERGNVQGAMEMRTRFHTVWLAADDVDRARYELAEGLAAWSQQGFHLAHFNGLLGFCQTALYEGSPEEAWSLWIAERERMRRSGFLRVQLVRIEADFLEGRVALAAAPLADAAKRLAMAHQAAARLEKAGPEYAQAMARLLGAGLAVRRGDALRVVRLLKSAVERFEKLDMLLYAAVARRRLGEVFGGQEGAAEISRADGWMREQSIRRPDLLVRVYAPGFEI